MHPISGLGIHNFRSFGPDTQYMSRFSKINIFIGENNSGKSNVLRFIHRVYGPVSFSGKASIDSLHDKRRGEAGLTSIPILIPCSLDAIKKALPGQDVWLYENFSTLLSDLSVGPKVLDHTWLKFSTVGSGIDFGAEVNSSYKHRLAHDVWSRLTGKSGGQKSDWFFDLSTRISQSLMVQAPTKLIPTLRRLKTRLSFYDGEYGGVDTSAGMIEELSKLERPTHDKPEDKVKFDALQDFLRRVLKRPGIGLEIPHDRKTIHVTDGNQMLPIEAMGTGIHQLLVLATEAMSVSDSVVCMEEPELHLHPELQHQLVHFLSNETSNQYFITTHSATILDTANASVFSARLVEGDTKIDTPLTRGARREVCHDLGYRASDLLQSNAILWVEGPSDRAYLINWLKSKDPHLEEGWHFSIMHYGGRLLSHISGAEVSLDEFIELLPINRFSSIVIDSDRKSSSARINDTKKRLQTEFQDGGRICWITKGREIENYIERSVRLAAIRTVHGENCVIIDSDDRFGRPLAFEGGRGANNVLDKMAIAREACKNVLSLDVLDLNERLNEVIRFIRRANRM